MADDVTEPGESTPAPAPADTAPVVDERRFSQADVDRLIQDRLARERRGAPKEKPKAPEVSQSSDGRQTLKQINDEVVALRMERDFDRLALREKLSEEQAEKLAPFYRAARSAAPDGWDGAAWLREIREAFGGGQTVKSNPQRTAAALDRPPVSDAGSPAAPATFTDDVPLWQLKQEDRQHLIKTKGLAWYATTLRSQLKGVRVQLRKP